MEIEKTCVICQRVLGEVNVSKHHLIPKSKGGKGSETILIHNICHQKIHSLFTEKELRDHFNTVDKLRSSEALLKFTKWVAKKDPGFYQSNKQSNNKRKR